MRRRGLLLWISSDWASVRVSRNSSDLRGRSTLRIQTSETSRFFGPADKRRYDEPLRHYRFLSCRWTLASVIVPSMFRHKICSLKCTCRVQKPVLAPRNICGYDFWYLSFGIDCLRECVIQIYETWMFVLIACACPHFVDVAGEWTIGWASYLSVSTDK